MGHKAVSATIDENDCEPWDWIPHVEGADRQKEINAFLRRLIDEMPIAKSPVVAASKTRHG